MYLNKNIDGLLPPQDVQEGSNTDYGKWYRCLNHYHETLRGMMQEPDLFLAAVFVGFFLATSVGHG